MRHLFVRIFAPVFLAVLVAFAGGVSIAGWILPGRMERQPRVIDAEGAVEERETPRQAEDPDYPLRELRAREKLIADALLANDRATAGQHVTTLNELKTAEVSLIAPGGALLYGAKPSPGTRDLTEKALQRNESLVLEDGPLVHIARLIPARSGVFVLAARIDRFGGQQWRRYVFQAAQLALAAIALGVVSFFLARSITRPVLRLRTAVRRFSEGRLDQRIGRSFGERRDELAELGRDFDLMAERIELLLAMQRRLLRDISHELRSPLTRQSVALEIVRRHVAPEAQNALDRAMHEGERLNELIGELLTLTRLEDRETAVDMAPTSLSEIVERVADDVSFEAKDRGRSVRLERCDECMTFGSHELLRRAVENVVRNAAAYTPEGAEVEISLAAAERQAVIRVRDHGPGVPPDELSEIFRPFYRVSQGRERKSGGVGLGLTIAERAVRSHGGVISAENAPDGGLVVEIRLPLRSPPVGRKA